MESGNERSNGDSSGVEKISRQADGIPQREIGVESAHGFGDCLFNVPLIRELSKLHKTTVAVAVQPHCKDAFYNLPWVSEIIEIPGMWYGIRKLQEMGFKRHFQITQNVKFFEYRGAHDHQHSLIHTPLWVGRELNCPKFDNRPVFLPTENEIKKTDSIISDKPTIAIESVYKSAQSWADRKAFDMILSKYIHTHRILWLSNHGAPSNPAVDDMLRFTRRECIMCLRAADILFSVGSGFFCSSIALSKEYQPKKIVCLWTDDLYKYEGPLNEYQWHQDITWVHNHGELAECLTKLQRS